MRHCWGTTTIPIHDPVTTRTGRETCERETAAWVHWYNTRRPLPLGGITPQQTEKQHTTTRKEAASTSLHKTRDLTHPLRGIAPVTSRCTRYVAIHPLRGAAPVTWRCTRYVALHPLRRAAPVTWRYTRYVALHPLRRAAPEQKGCNAYRSGAMPTHRVHDPPSQAHMRTCPNGGRRTRQAWLRPAAAQPPQPTAPDGGAVQTAGWARGRQGLTGLRDDEPSGRLATQTTSGPPSAQLASLPRHKARARRSRSVEARARGTHATSPGTTRAYDEAGTRRAKQRRGPRPRQQVRPGDPP